MTWEEYRKLWAVLTDEERQRVHDKADLERMSTWETLNNWPDAYKPTEGEES